MLVMLASLVALLAIRVLRIAVARDAVRKTDTFWTGPPLGVVYSTAWAANLTLSTIFYIKGLSAMRRLSASEYHVHPETLRKRDYEARMKARSMHMYHSRNQLMPYDTQSGGGWGREGVVKGMERLILRGRGSKRSRTNCGAGRAASAGPKKARMKGNG